MTRKDIIKTAIVLFIFPGYALAVTRYVKQAATGAGDCSSWTNACTLPTAIHPETGVAQNGDEVWVQTGAYAPIGLKNGVKIIGGFAGSESTASQSIPTSHLTIIDGGGTARAVSGFGEGPSTVLRGFTIRNGMADDGGGLSLENSGALFVHCIFENNQAGDFGAAVSVRGTGSPQFINCIFRNNGIGEGNDVHPYGGGAVFVHRGSPQFVNCLFHDNRAGEGGVVVAPFGTPTFINCTLHGNHAAIGYGGAFFDPDGRMTFLNCIVWGNITTRGIGYAEQGYSGSGGTSRMTYSAVQGGWTGVGNISSDPLFQNAAAYDFKLQSTSPCKNAGENAALPSDVGNLDWDMDTDETIPLDLIRFVRKSGPTVDIGAYEVQPSGPGGGGDP